MEDKFILSDSISRDLQERLKIDILDEATCTKRFKTIKEIASILHIGQKFKIPQIEILYIACTKNTIQLNKIKEIVRLFKLTANNIKDDDLEKNILCRTICNYLKHQQSQDPEQCLLHKIADSYGLVDSLAHKDSTRINIFYNTHKEADVEFSRGEIFDKFYSVNYGVVISNMGQIKTPIFFSRNYKSAEDECKRLDIMSYALKELPPAKFMLFALHFDKYLEKVASIDEELAIGSMQNVIPIIKNEKNKILNSVGNIWGTDITDHGSSGFIFRCLTSRVTPYNITRLCRIAEQIPSSDDNRFEQIRLDAISIDHPWPNLRSYIHNQQPEQHKLLKRMALYYDATKKIGEELPLDIRTQKLHEIIEYIDKNSAGYNLGSEDLFNINKYDQVVYDYERNPTKAIDIIQRMRHNTTPRTLEIPTINDPHTKHLLEEIVDTQYPFSKHEVYGEYLQKLNNHLERKMKAEAIGIKPKTINSILWSERRGFMILENMDAGYQLSAFKSPWFKEILRFYELTNSAENKPTQNLGKFLHLIEGLKMEDAYQIISMRVTQNIVSLNARQHEDSRKYYQYISNLSNISDKNKILLQSKINESLKLKISRNLSGYGMANALYNCATPRRTPYKALEKYMKNRHYY